VIYCLFPEFFIEMLNNLPKELVFEIVSYLDARTLAVFPQICRDFWNVEGVPLSEKVAREVVCWSSSWLGRICTPLNQHYQVLFNHITAHPQLVLKRQVQFADVVEVACISLLVRLNSLEKLQKLIEDSTESVKKFAHFLEKRFQEVARQLQEITKRFNSNIVAVETFYPAHFDKQLASHLKVYFIAKALLQQNQKSTRGSTPALQHTARELGYIGSLHPGALMLARDSHLSSNTTTTTTTCFRSDLESPYHEVTEILRINPFYFSDMGGIIQFPVKKIFDSTDLPGLEDQDVKLQNAQIALKCHPFVFYFVPHALQEKIKSLPDSSAQLAALDSNNPKYIQLLKTALQLDPSLLLQSCFSPWLDSVEIVQEACAQMPSILEKLPRLNLPDSLLDPQGRQKKLLELRAFAAQILCQFPEYYSWFPEEIQNDRELLLSVLKKNHKLYKYLQGPFLNDPEFMELGIEYLSAGIESLQV
jgi:hypothetical protein